MTLALDHPLLQDSGILANSNFGNTITGYEFTEIHNTEKHRDRLENFELPILPTDRSQSLFFIGGALDIYGAPHLLIKQIASGITLFASIPEGLTPDLQSVKSAVRALRHCNWSHDTFSGDLADIPWTVGPLPPQNAKDAAPPENKKAALLNLLASWLSEGRSEDEERSLQCTIESLDANRAEARKLFPNT